MVLSMIACLFGEFTQSSLESITPLGPYNSKVGFASLSANGREVPIPRMITFFGCVPVMMKPPMRTLSPVSTRKRVEMLARVVTEGVAVGVADAAGVGLGKGGGVAVGVGEGTGPSSLIIVPRPWLSAITALVASLKLTTKVSLISGVVSPLTGTVIVALVTPAVKVRVPLRAP